MKPLIELELGSIQFVYGEYFVNDDMGIDVRSDKIYFCPNESKDVIAKV